MGSKRKLIDELLQGVESMQAQREGRIALRTHVVRDLASVQVKADDIRVTREQLRLSRQVFANHLGVSIRTLASWEEGRTKPNNQAAALILMVRKHPDTLERLSGLEAAG